MKMAGILVNTFGDTSKGRFGPLVCRDAFHFDLQPLDHVKPSVSHNNDRMQFSAAHVAPDEVKRGEQVKNLSLGLAMTFSFSAGSLFLYCAWKARFRSEASPCSWPPSPSRQPPAVDFFSTGAGAGHLRELASVEASLLQGSSPAKLAAMHTSTPSKQPMKGCNPLSTGSRQVHQVGLVDRAPSFTEERTYQLSRSPSINSTQSLNSLPQRESTLASFLDQQHEEQQQQQQQRQSQPQFGNEIQPPGYLPGHGGGSSRDSQASSGTRSATASAEAGHSGDGDHAGVDTALADEAMTLAHVVIQEDERNDQAQAQRGQMPQEWVQQTRGTEGGASRALALSSLSEHHRPPLVGSSERSVQDTSIPPGPRSSCHSPRQRASLSPARRGDAAAATFCNVCLLDQPVRQHWTQLLRIL